MLGLSTQPTEDREGPASVGWDEAKRNPSITLFDRSGTARWVYQPSLRRIVRTTHP